MNRLAAFTDFCGIHNAKAILIELAKGDFTHQPMLSKVAYAETLNQALSVGNMLSSQLQQGGFEVKRLKIEIPANRAHELITSPSGFSSYFEWHGKLSYTAPDDLIQLAVRHKAHLSFNALSGQSDTRFLTLREYGTEQLFRGRVQALVRGLSEGDWRILKQEFEYCVYDNNAFLDQGWLPQ